MIDFPEAVKKRNNVGLTGLRQYIAEKAGCAANAVDLDALIGEWCTSRKGDMTDKQLQASRGHVTAFLVWLKLRAKVSVVTPDLLTKDNLKAYRDEQVSIRHQRAIEKAIAKAVREGLKMNKAERGQREERLLGSVRATVNRHINSIGAFGTWLVEEKKLLTVSPAKGVRWSTKAENNTRDSQYRYLESEDVKVMLTVAEKCATENALSRSTSEPDHEFLAYLVSTGARTLSEGTKLMPRHIRMDRADREAGTVPVHLPGTKNDTAPREVDITVSLAERLLKRATRLRIKRDRLIFPFSDKDYMAFWRIVLERVRLERPDVWDRVSEATPYALRHSFAVAALRNGVDLEQLRVLMGHESIETTHMYAKHIRRPAPALKAMADEFGIT